MIKSILDSGDSTSVIEKRKLLMKNKELPHQRTFIRTVMLLFIKHKPTTIVKSALIREHCKNDSVFKFNRKGLRKLSKK